MTPIAECATIVSMTTTMLPSGAEAGPVSTLIGDSGARYDILDIEIVDGYAHGTAEGVRTGCLVSFRQTSHHPIGSGFRCLIHRGLDDDVDVTAGWFPAALLRGATVRAA